MEGFLSLLPYALLFLMCPLMMLFMGHGRGHGHGQGHDHAHDDDHEHERDAPQGTAPEERPR